MHQHTDIPQVFPPSCITSCSPWRTRPLAPMKLLCQIKRHFLASNEWQTLDDSQILFINVTNHIYLLLHFPKLFSNLGTCCLHLNLALVSPCSKLLPRVLPYSFFCNISFSHFTVCLWLIHVIIWQEPTHSKAIIPQFKKIPPAKKKNVRLNHRLNSIWQGYPQDQTSGWTQCLLRPHCVV